MEIVAADGVMIVGKSELGEGERACKWLGARLIIFAGVSNTIPKARVADFDRIDAHRSRLSVIFESK